MTDADNPSRPVPRDGPLAAPEAVSGVLPELPAHEGPEQRKLQAVWEHAGDAMLFLDCDGLLDCNDAGLRQFGLDSRDALLGLPLHAFAPPCQPDGTASRNAFDEGLARALLTGCERFEWVFRRTDLSPLTLDVVLHGVSMGGGQVAHGIFRDVTRQREAARQLELNRQGGERDGQVLGAMKNARIQASVEEIAKSLHGNWRAGHLFALKQALGAFDFIGTQLTECDQEIEAQLQRLQTHDGEPAKGKKRGRARNAPKFDLRTQLFKMCGVDLTRIDGIDVTTALAVISETGADMSRFPTVGHFASWMGLCPGTKITGGKVMSGKTKRCANRAPQALRLAAAALRTSRSALGAYFRRMCSRMDKPKAVTAAAHKLARLIYTMLTKGEEYTDQGQEYYEERYRERVLRQLSQRAQKLGMKLVATEQPA